MWLARSNNLKELARSKKHSQICQINEILAGEDTVSTGSVFIASGINPLNLQ
jgi:hypothetical protein